MSNYAQQFLALINDNFVRMTQELAPLKSRSGRDVGYRENTLRKFVRTVALPDGLLIERKIPTDPIPACVDYCIVDGPLEPSNVRATCELKGPTRMSFLRPDQGVKWRNHFLKDVRKQHARAKALPQAEHYVALLVPASDEELRKADCEGVIRQVVEAVPGARIDSKAAGAVDLRYPLTTMVLRVY